MLQIEAVCWLDLHERAQLVCLQPEYDCQSTHSAPIHCSFGSSYRTQPAIRTGDDSLW